MKTIKTRLTFCLFLLLAFSYKAHSQEIEFCSSAKEFKTTFNYLKSEKDLELDIEQKKSLADEVSKHCAQSAKRFVVTTRILLQAGLNGSDAIEKGLELSKATHGSFEIFIHVFELAYLSNQLDLNLNQSIQLANRVGLELENSEKYVKKSFDQVIKACLKKELPIATNLECAEFAVKVAQQSSRFSKNLSLSVLNLYEYLTQTKKINLVHFQAFETLNELIEYGPKIYENFKQAYEFASSQNGLDLERQRSFEMALKMAKRSFQQKDENI